MSWLAPATTVAAYRRGDRGDPELAFAHALGPAAPPNAGQGRGGELRAVQAPVQPVRLFPGEQDLGPGTGQHGEAGPDRDRVAQPHRPLGRCHADALVALPTEELGALVGVVSQGAQDRTRGGQQAVLAGGRGELTEARAQDESALHVT